MENRTHYFLAVRIPDETKLIMKDHMDELKKRISFSRWVHYQDLHITLAFLGGASQEKLAGAVNNVQEAVKGEKALHLKITNLGIFGNEDAPRVFWADTEKSQELQDIRKKVFSACEAAGFQLETRPFRPHITLARKWSGEESFKQGLLNLWEELQPVPIPFQASDVVLYQTHLNQSPKYGAKKIFTLLT